MMSLSFALPTTPLLVVMLLDIDLLHAGETGASLNQ